jgi:hypothetical protein
MPTIVQFFHPGVEHGYDNETENGKVKCWNDGAHKRKFIRSAAKYIMNDMEEEGEIVFWGEWEPPSTVRELVVPDGNREYPKYVHTPDLTSTKKDWLGRRSNTDPYVFGTNFKYAICMQQKYKKLRHLESGSLILFGSRLNSRFVIDTIFVVNDAFPYKTADDPVFSADEIYREAVIKMAYDPAANKSGEKTVYFGASYAAQYGGMFSFVPAQTVAGGSVETGFPRFKMPFEFYSEKYSTINAAFAKWETRNDKLFEGKNMGVKITEGVDIAIIKELWRYIRENVSKEYALGHELHLP